MLIRYMESLDGVYRELYDTLDESHKNLRSAAELDGEISASTLGSVTSSGKKRGKADLLMVRTGGTTWK